MATVAERQAARRAEAQKKLKAAGKKRATSLAATAERTAQRRGRALADPLVVVQQAVAPKRQAAPPKTRFQQACDVIGGVGRLSGPTVSRGVSFTCGDKPIAFSSAFPNNTTVRVFGQAISSNQRKLRAAGFGDFIPFSAGDEASLARSIKIARKKRNFALVERLQAGGCKAGSRTAVSKSTCRNLKTRGLF